LDDNKPLVYKKTLNSFWYKINDKNVKKISFKTENDEFKNVTYDKMFWESYKFPDKF